jgi:hypothetical protein
MLMTEEAELAKLYACFHQLSDAHKREILAKAAALADNKSAARKTAEPAKEKRLNKKRQ